MKLSLSPRLLECCKYVMPGDRVADIGCDHGMLSVYLLKNNIASSVAAADINEGPLNAAKSNAARYGISRDITFHLSDGLKQVPHNFNCMVCAGMGAETMISILKSAPWLRTDHYRLIFQCQTKTHLLREYLSESGWEIRDESIVRDGHFLYTVMNVCWNPGHPLTPGEHFLSPALIRSPSAELREYYSRISEGLRQAVEGRGRENVPYLSDAYDELMTDPAFYRLKEK